MNSKAIEDRTSGLWLSTALVFSMFAVAIPYREGTASTEPQAKAGSDVQVASPMYREADEAIKTHDHSRLQALLKKSRSLVESMPRAKSGRRSSLLTSAIYSDDEVSVRMLLENGADPNGKDEAVPLNWAIDKLNIMPLDVPGEIRSLRLYVPSESERIIKYMRKSQQTRARIILLLLNAGANYNVARNSDKNTLSLFQSLMVSLCDLKFHDPEVLALFREVGVVFRWKPGSEIVFGQNILENAATGILDRACVNFMYGR